MKTEINMLILWNKKEKKKKEEITQEEQNFVAQAINIHHTYITSLQSSHLHNQPMQKFGCFMPLYHTMTAQVPSQNLQP